MDEIDSKIFISDFAKKLKQNGFATYWSIKGCLEIGVREIEKNFGYHLPKIYREFLLKMGLGAGKFYQGTDIFWEKGFLDYRDWTEFREAFLDILKDEKSNFELTNNCFVFAHHQGYIFWFFYVQIGEENPPVYGYKDREIKKVSDSFSAFLLESLEEQKELLKFF